MRPGLEVVVRPALFHVQYALWRVRGRSGLVPHVHKEAILRDYARRHQLRILVETGTYKGDMVAALRKDFDAIHSIELDPELYKRALARFAGVKNLFLYKGDSAQVLPKVLHGLASPALFWLDGHFSGGVTAKAGVDTPVRTEIGQIFEHPHAHVVLIDDARLFTGAGDYPSLDELETLVRRVRPEASITAEDDVVRVVTGQAGTGAAGRVSGG